MRLKYLIMMNMEFSRCAWLSAGQSPHLQVGFDRKAWLKPAGRSVRRGGTRSYPYGRVKIRLLA